MIVVEAKIEAARPPCRCPPPMCCSCRLLRSVLGGGRLDHPVDEVDVAQDVGDERDSGPGVPPGRDQRPQVLVGQGVEALVGLVEEQQVRGVELGQGDVEFLLRATGQGSGGARPLRGPAQAAEEAVAGGDRAGAAGAADRAEQPQMLVDGKQRGERALLARLTEAGGALHDARARAQQAGAHVQQCGLARSVGADDGGDLASTHSQADVAEHGAPAAAGAHVAQPEHDRTGLRGRRGLRGPVMGAVERGSDVLQGGGELAGVQHRRARGSRPDPALRDSRRQ